MVLVASLITYEQRSTEACCGSSKNDHQVVCREVKVINGLILFERSSFPPWDAAAHHLLAAAGQLTAGYASPFFAALAW